MKIYGLTVVSTNTDISGTDLKGNNYCCESETILCLSKEEVIDCALKQLNNYFNLDELKRDALGEPIDENDGTLAEFQTQLINGEGIVIQYHDYHVEFNYFVHDMPDLVLAKENEHDISKSFNASLKTKSDFKEYVYDFCNEDRTDDYEISTRGDANDLSQTDFIVVKKGKSGWVYIASVEDSWKEYCDCVVEGPVDEKAYFTNLRNRFDTIIRNHKIMNILEGPKDDGGPSGVTTGALAGPEI